MVKTTVLRDQKEKTLPVPITEEESHQDPLIKAKYQATEEAMAQIREKFGDGAIMKLGDSKKLHISVIPTGCLSLDIALGVLGVPRGRIVEIFGAESSGKTTLAHHIMAESQKLGGIAAFIDAEHALDTEYAARLGVNIKELLVSQPDTGEQALDIVETLVRSNAIDVIVVDSVAALTPKAEIEGEMGEQHMGLQARLMSQALRKLTAIISKSKSVVVFINQTRQKIGVFFGNPETTTGGTALKFYASVRMEVRKSAQIKQGEVVIGGRTKVKIVKNKVAPPFRQTEFDLMYNEGISLAGDILDTGVLYQMVEKIGNTYMFVSEKLGVGRENAKRALMEHPEIREKLRQMILDRFKNGGKSG